jgi:O-antigen/teichoic acid export membrane protein
MNANNLEKRNISHRFSARAGLLSISRIVQVSIIFFIFWLYSVFLNREEYGEYQKIFVLIGLCSAVLSLGLPLLVSSFPVSQTITFTRMIFRRNLKYYLLTCFILTAVVFALHDFVPFISKSLLVLLSVCNAVYQVYEIMAIKLNKDIPIFIYNLLYSIIYLAIHVAILFLLPFSINWLLSWLLFLSIIRLAWIYWAQIRPGEVKEPLRTDEVLVYQRQWTYLSLNETLENISKQIDKFYLLGILSASAFAIYFNGAYEIPLISILISVSGTFIIVQSRQLDLNDSDILSVFHKNSLLLSTLLFPLFFFLQLNSNSIFEILFRGKYNESVGIFQISSWIIPLRIANYTAILQTKLKSEIILRGSIMSLLIKLAGCFLFYLFWNVRGVAFAVVLGTMAQAAYYLYRSSVELKTKIDQILPVRKLAISFLISGIVSLFVRWLFLSSAPLLQIISGIFGMACLTLGFLMAPKYISKSIWLKSSK